MYTLLQNSGHQPMTWYVNYSSVLFNSSLCSETEKNRRPESDAANTLNA